MVKKLPTKLEREPLLEAVCELVLRPKSIGLQAIVPGILHTHLGDEITGIEQALPNAPQGILPGIMFGGVMTRIKWKNYIVSVQERSISVSIVPPYNGWDNYRAAVVSLFGFILTSNIAAAVERYSIKYANFFEDDPSDEKSGLGVLDWKLDLGGKAKTAANVQLRVEEDNGDTITVTSIISKANATLANSSVKSGAVVEVDTLCSYITEDLKAFKDSLDDRFKTIRAINKQAFFDCITEEAIEAMGPTYAS